MKEENKEIKVGKNRVYLDGDKILHFKLVGKQDYDLAVNTMEAGERLTHVFSEILGTIVDFSEVGLTSLMSRNMGQQWLEDKGHGKTALVGGGSYFSAIAGFVMGVTKKHDFAIFRSEEEAIKWLKG